ncbi:ATP-dependent RNA helicase SrmB [Shewanella zhangzhouensis]|uniref:ATP-dependent RNA helicase SrmB n=1 Tax=Shewanella zhangzhouensis TaxID=2864213 RepID=UPI0021ABB1DD|nr:ATP-dependent RNA helicase SrmB [Shewanella zhangzhouensis]
MLFEDFQLDPELLESLKAMGHNTPTTIQRMTIPLAMEQRDILARAPTGTGKTASFLLPALQHLIDFPRRRPGQPRVLVLTPTRELASQIHRYASHLATNLELDIKLITGGVPYGPQEEMLKSNVDILVATPGRLLEYLDKGHFSAELVEVLVIDEADRMLDMGFGEVVKTIAVEASGRKQAMLFSATLEGGGVGNFARELLNEPVFVESEPPRSEKAKIHQWIHLADDKDHKFALLTHLLKQEEVKRAIVFCKTRDVVASLEGQLQQAGIACAFMRGDMDQKKRFQALGRFTKGEVNVLLATDVAARGIDIEDITHVINFDMPRSADTYVHRIGRTGRAGAKGTAISLVEAHDMRILGKVERYIEQPLKRRVIEELRPKHKEAKVPTKKKVKAKDAKAKAKNPKPKAAPGRGPATPNAKTADSRGGDNFRSGGRASTRHTGTDDKGDGQEKHERRGHDKQERRSHDRADAGRSQHGPRDRAEGQGYASRDGNARSAKREVGEKTPHGRGDKRHQDAGSQSGRGYQSAERSPARDRANTEGKPRHKAEGKSAYSAEGKSGYSAEGKTRNSADGKPRYNAQGKDGKRSDKGGDYRSSAPKGAGGKNRKPSKAE